MNSWGYLGTQQKRSRYQLQLPSLQEVPAAQTLPQTPQLALSLLVFTHAPPEHWICPAAQLAMHRSSTHTCAPTHVVVQSPQ
jgi:hypothetical protein